MLNRLRRHIFWIVLTAVLLVAAVFGARGEASTLGFTVEGENSSVRIEIYRAEDGCQYVFLPAGVELNRVFAAPTGNGRFVLNGRELAQGVSCDGLETGIAYPLESDDGTQGNLQFLRAGQQATLFITTASGSLETIHSDKNQKEDMWLQLWDGAGICSIRSGVGTMKGRGNATWKYEKKPYSLALAEKTDLLGMGAAENWVLLANATDQSNLHNYLALQLAAGSGLQWTPECRFVNLYLNGEYQGLYLLAEKVEIGEERLDISSGDFLGKVDFASRWKSLSQPFKTNAGRTVEITSPEGLGEDRKTQIQALVNRMEDGILSGSLEGMDLDSWVRRYLVDEIVGNIDADLASSYFYGKDDAVFAGPVWDYDRAFGNTPRNENPESFIAATGEKARGIRSVYYGALAENEVFQARVAELYRDEFLPRLQAWSQGEILAIAEEISASTRMNDIRWAAMFAHLQEVDPSAERVLDYVNRRAAFLSSAWLENVEYCNLQLELTSGSFYRNFAVKQGETPDLTQIGAFLKDMDLETARWTDTAGNPASLTDPVTEDRILRLVQTGEQIAVTPAAETEPGSGEPALPVILFGLLVIGLFGMILRELRSRSKR